MEYLDLNESALGKAPLTGAAPKEAAPAAKVALAVEVENAPAEGGAKTDAAPAKDPPKAFQAPSQEFQFFNRDLTKRICIPSYCRRLKENEKYAIATKANKLLEAWAKAGGAAQTAETMPGPVDAAQFIAFYKVIAI